MPINPTLRSVPQYCHKFPNRFPNRPKLYAIGFGSCLNTLAQHKEIRGMAGFNARESAKYGHLKMEIRKRTKYEGWKVKENFKLKIFSWFQKVRAQKISIGVLKTKREINAHQSFCIKTFEISMSYETTAKMGSQHSFNFCLILF